MSLSLFDQSYNELYEKMFEAIGFTLDTSKYSFAQVGFASQYDLINSNQPQCNKNIFYIGNELPASSDSYAAIGDFITNYAIFLDYLQSKDQPKQNIAELSKQVEEKIEIDKQLTNYQRSLMGLKSNSNTQGFVKMVSAAVPLTDVAQLLNSLKTVEENILSKMPRTKSNLRTSAPSLTEARSFVSFLTGARKITGANIYNMPVNTTPPKNSNSYAPNYKLMGLSDVIDNWETNRLNNDFPVEVSASGNSSFGTPAAKIPLGNSLFGVDVLFQNSNECTSVELGAYQIKAAFSGLGFFSISPDNWFEPSFFRMSGYEYLFPPIDFFSKKGTLNLIPIKVLIGYNVGFKVKFTSEGYQSFQKYLVDPKTPNSFHFGASTFNTSGQNKNANLVSNESSNSVTIYPTSSQVPYLLGVVSRNVSEYINNPTSIW